MTVKIGVLGLQGAVSEHLQALAAVGAEGSTVKRPEQLADLDGLILPGGESTTMRRLMDRSGLFEAIKAFAEEKPIFGTCAGLILLAKKIEGQAGPLSPLLHQLFRTHLSRASPGHAPGPFGGGFGAGPGV